MRCRWLCLGSLVLFGTGLLFAESYAIVLASGARYNAISKYRHVNQMVCFNLKPESELCFPFEEIDWYRTAELNGEQPPAQARRIYHYEDGTWGYDPPKIKIEMPSYGQLFSGDALQGNDAFGRLARDLRETKSYLVPSLELSRFSSSTLVLLTLCRLLIWLISMVLAIFYCNGMTSEVSRFGLVFYTFISIILQLVYLEIGAQLFGWIGFSLALMLILHYVQWRFLVSPRIDLDAGDSNSLAKFMVILDIVWIALIWGLGYLLL